MRKIKIGIDVGGTFTHAVAIDIFQNQIIGKSCVPTTHTANEGVAKGVVSVMKNLIDECKIGSEEIILIAHSTTQATNALLEGDVAPVGIIGMGKGLESVRAKNETNIGNVPLGGGKYIRTFHRYIDSSKNFKSEYIRNIVNNLLDEGAKVIVAAESFGVDDPKNEEYVGNIVSEIGVPVILCSAISQLYGLRVRTRTAVINASILPKMVETADMTERSVREAGINAPLMVMRSDGGIMDIQAMRRRPILTILSGPAAGIAAALMYIKISDGIFIEVGGTSSDISVIKNGRPLVKTAEVGGHRLYLKTLDVRTLGIAGGSLIRAKNYKIIDVGPRSAHIAGLKYCAFSDEENFEKIEAVNIQPKSDDPDDYIAIKKIDKNIPEFAITTTEASNYFNLVTNAGYGKGNLKSVNKVFDYLSKKWNESKDKIAEQILTISANKIIEVIKILMKEYHLTRDLITLVGGGGGAESIVPFTSKLSGINYKIAENTEVISAIGVALGIIRDTVERNIINPTSDDILNIRREAAEKIQKMGAKPETIEVVIEIDRQTKRISAIATGSSEMKMNLDKKTHLSNEDLSKICSKSMMIDEVILAAETNLYKIFTGSIFIKKVWGIFRKEINPIRVIDDEGVIKLQLRDGRISVSTISEIEKAISVAINELTIYGDAGALLPDLFLICSGKIIDLTGLINIEQMISVARIETEKYSKDEKIIIIYSERGI